MSYRVNTDRIIETVVESEGGNDRELVLWHDVVETERAFEQARSAFLQAGGNLAKVLSRALWNPRERASALRVLRDFDTDQHLRRELFPQLVEMASVTHRDLG